jgi:hypothetical protein
MHLKTDGPLRSRSHRALNRLRNILDRHFPLLRPLAGMGSSFLRPTKLGFNSFADLLPPTRPLRSRLHICAVIVKRHLILARRRVTNVSGRRKQARRPSREHLADDVQIPFDFALAAFLNGPHS